MRGYGPAGLSVWLDPSGTLFLRGELDLATVQDLQDKIDEIMVPGQPVILDLARLTFLSSSGIHCLTKTWEASGHPVVLLNTTPWVRLILELGNFLELREPGHEAWVFDGEGPSSSGVGRACAQPAPHDEPAV
jgi:anti-anti-sigma factor